MKTLKKKIFSLLVFFSIWTFSVAQITDTELISQNKLIEDFRQLVDIIESTHPDPYIYGGGKITFHRRIHQTISKIP